MKRKKWVLTDGEDGKLLGFKVSEIETVEAHSYGGRNMGCVINGKRTTAPFDSVIKELHDVNGGFVNFSRMPDCQIEDKAKK